MLDDDEYVAAVGAIIERDFFAPSDGGAPTARAASAPDETLDDFLAHTTSEDNVSFEALQEAGVEEQRRRWWWAHSTDQLLPDDRAAVEAYDAAKQRRLVADAAPDRRPGALAMWPHTAANALMFPPGGAGRHAQSRRREPAAAAIADAAPRALLADAPERAELLAAAVRAGLLDTRVAAQR